MALPLGVQSTTTLQPSMASSVVKSTWRPSFSNMGIRSASVQSLAPRLQQVLNLGTVGQQGRPLVEDHLVDTQLGLEVTEQTDERFADGPGADDENVLRSEH